MCEAEINLEVKSNIFNFPSWKAQHDQESFFHPLIFRLNSRKIQSNRFQNPWTTRVTWNFREFFQKKFSNFFFISNREIKKTFSENFGRIFLWATPNLTKTGSRLATSSSLHLKMRFNISALGKSVKKKKIDFFFSKNLLRIWEKIWKFFFLDKIRSFF